MADAVGREDDFPWVMGEGELDAALDALGLTPDERFGVEIVAAMKAELYGKEHLQMCRQVEILHCLTGIDDELEEAVTSGTLTRERGDLILERERSRLLEQAAYLGLVTRRHALTQPQAGAS